MYYIENARDNEDITNGIALRKDFDQYEHLRPNERRCHARSSSPCRRILLEETTKERRRYDQAEQVEREWERELRHAQSEHFSRNCLNVDSYDLANHRGVLSHVNFEVAN